MKQLPCPRCGNTDVVDTFCRSCLRELHPLVEKVKEVTMTFCVVSGKVKIGTGWEDLNPQEALLKAARKALVVVDGAEVTVDDYDFSEFMQKPGIHRVLEVVATVTKDYSEEYVIPIILRTTVSPKFAKLGTNYYEATLQLRNEKEEHRKVLEKLVAKYDGLAVNKEIPQDKGTDYLMTEKQSMKKIAYKLQHLFGGLLKENVRLITRDHLRSKDVYRLTIFIEFPPYERGDILVNDERLVRFDAPGKKLRFTNILTGKKIEEQYEPGKYEYAEIHDTTVTQVEPKLFILDTNYQQVPVIGQAGLDEKVKAVFFKKKWYLVTPQPKKDN